MILAVNTSTLQFGLALLNEDGTVLTEFFMSKGGGHFGNLMPALDFLLQTSTSDIHEVKCVIVAMGPGSFTGLRVGLSAAKGLSHALDIPIIGISSLESLACQFPFSAFPIAPVLHSRKGELFTARFRWTAEHNLIRDKEDVCIKIEDFPQLFDEPTLFIGNDFLNQGPAIKKMLGTRAVLAPPQFWNFKGAALGILGLERFRSSNFDDPHNLNPLYMRPPDIRPNPTPIISNP